jgi:hypothetical protein
MPVIVMVVMVMVVMVMVVMVRVLMVMVVMVRVLMVMVVMVMVVMVMVMVVMVMTVEKTELVKCMQYEKFASFCHSILHMVTPACHCHYSTPIAKVQARQSNSKGSNSKTVVTGIVYVGYSCTKGFPDVVDEEAVEKVNDIGNVSTD